MCLFFRFLILLYFILFYLLYVVYFALMLQRVYVCIFIIFKY